MLFNPARLSFARKLRGLTKRKLAHSTGLNERTISVHESGAEPPEHGSILLYADALKFPQAFFFGDTIDEIPENAVSFRSLSKMTLTKRDMSLSEGSIAVKINEWFEAHFKLPSLDLPDLGSGFEMFDDAPEIVAESLRSYWGLGTRPIKNILHLVESKGIKVYSLSEAPKDADGFSFWYNNETPFILYDYSARSAERCRFDIAHELGHLLLHRKEPLKNKNSRFMEREADTFASAFLMPSKAVKTTAPQTITWQNLLVYKQYWNVSMKAIVYKLYKLGRISDWTNRSFNIKANQYGYKNEPNPSPHEIPQIISKALDALAKEGRTMADFAKELDLHSDDLASYLFGLKIQNKRPTLTLVK